MNQIVKTLLLLTAVGAGYSVHAISPDNRYETIIDRNIFRLNPPPEASTNSPAEIVPERKVDLSGLSNVAGNKKAWFVVAPKAGSKDLPLYLSLSEGERQDFLEVLNINEESGEVKVKNAGNPMTLSLKVNSLKPQAVAPTAPVPAPASRPPTPIPAPQQPAATSYGNNSYSSGQSVTVTGGTPVSSATTSGQTTEGSGLRSIPTRTLRLAPVATQTKPVDPVTQIINMERDRQDKLKQGLTPPPPPPIPGVR